MNGRNEEKRLSEVGTAEGREGGMDDEEREGGSDR